MGSTMGRRMSEVLSVRSVASLNPFTMIPETAAVDSREPLPLQEDYEGDDEHDINSNPRNHEWVLGITSMWMLLPPVLTCFTPLQLDDGTGRPDWPHIGFACFIACTAIVSTLSFMDP